MIVKPRYNLIYMYSPGTTVLFIWMIFWIYWIVSASDVKKNVVDGSNAWRRSASIRIFLIIALVVFFSLPPVQIWFGTYNYTYGIAWQTAGIVICLAGILFAIWARRHLGRNWSATPSVKEGRELVTSGPYRYVRHPIYTGILLAMLGSVIIGGLFYVALFALIALIFIWRIKIEEEIMMRLFPEQYPSYKKRTKALIPFIW